MKRCPYCGREYSDEDSICAIDKNPLESCGDTPPSRQPKTAKPRRPWTIAVCILVGVLIVSYLASNHSGEHESITFGHTTIDTVLIGFFAVQIILFVSAIAFIIQGFRVHWGWGLANLLLFPVAGIALFITHRREATYPMIIWSFGMALLVILLISVSI